MSKILIMYGSVGLGHKVVAENIAQALREHPGVEIVELDVLEMYKSGFTKVSAKIYDFIITHLPWLWRFFYTNSLFLKLTLPLRVPLAGRKIGKFREYLQDLKPDLIFTAHPTATALVAYLKQRKEYSGPLVTTFSDFHFQPYWVYPAVDHYLVMTGQQQMDVVKLGFAKEQITVTGLPVHETFARDYDVSVVLRKFSLAKNKSMILVMGGSIGWGININDIQELLRSNFEMQVAVITGKNSKLEQKLREMAKDREDLKVFGNLPQAEVAQLYAAAKLLVTKPGGLSCAQALLMKLPMVLTHPIPGGEEQNLRYLVTQGVAVSAASAEEVRMWVERLLQDRKSYQELREHCRILARPDAARDAARILIDTLPSRG